MNTKVAAESAAASPAKAPRTKAVKKVVPEVKVEAAPVSEPEVSKPAKAEKAAKPAKVKRDSFTFPESDYEKISELKKTCLAMGINAKKSEILRAGLHALAALDQEGLKSMVSRVEKIKTGRPLGSESEK
ncbi:MAG: hypothetical protein HKL98_13095 [Burkholderiales bacterium]|nr:hypothetical protein [Burkholderiales bacterium]